jgi:hypothetical protein
MLTPANTACSYTCGFGDYRLNSADDYYYYKVRYMHVILLRTRPVGCERTKRSIARDPTHASILLLLCAAAAVVRRNFSEVNYIPKWI